MGDYDISGGPCQVLERKTGSDFLISLAQGRLFPQLTALQKSRFAPILLREGNPLGINHSQMRPESIRGKLSYITAILVRWQYVNCAKIFGGLDKSMSFNDQLQ